MVPVRSRPLSLALGVVLALVAMLAAGRARAADTPETALVGLHRAAPALDTDVLALALRAVDCAGRSGKLDTPRTLTVIDYSLPSTHERLWVLDLERRSLVYEELVAHGRGSGENDATKFSNDEGSHQSSLGLFVTLDSYSGKHGRSLRLKGLEPGVNDHAVSRAIVIHGADYVSDAFAAKHGRLGRSFGCPALTQEAAPGVIDRIQGGAPVFVYYPDARWLADSRFLGQCTQAATP